MDEPGTNGHLEYRVWIETNDTHSEKFVTVVSEDVRRLLAMLDIMDMGLYVHTEIVFVPHD